MHNRHPQHIRSDVGEYRQIERVIKETNPDYVYHLAAEFGRVNGDEYYEQNWRTNVIGTRNILETQVDHGFCLIFASSSEVYGEHPADMIREEDVIEGAPAPRLTNDYAISKWVNEQQILNAEERHGSEIVRLRFFNAYGPGEYYTPYRSVVCLFCYHALTDQPFDVYRGYKRTFMYIDDFIPTLARVCDNFEPGTVYNIGGQDWRSVEDLAKIVLDYIGKSDDLVNYLGEDEHNTKSKYPDIRYAYHQFGHEPRTILEMGVPDTIDWMRKVYQL